MNSIQTKSGGDLVSAVSKLAEKIGIPLKNWHLPKHNFTGPFTELDKRIDENDNPLLEYKPYNQIDEIAMRHDICYRDADKYGRSRSECDKIMLNELNALKTKNFREKVDYALVKPVIWLKYKLGLGLPEDMILAEELHAPIKHKFKKRRVLVFNIHDIWSADLKDMQSLSKQNKNYKYLLNVIDLFSRYAYSIPLKSKSSTEIINAFEKLFSLGVTPKKLWTDRGSEFINNRFKQFLKDNNIELYHTYNEGKAVVIERFNRTLGEMIQKYLTATRQSNYIDALQKLIDDYNNKYHTSIKMTPYEAALPEIKDKILQTRHVDTVSKLKFKVGDRVRIYRYKKTFEKGYMPNWTREIFVVDKIKYTDPVTYVLKDLKGEDILGSFYEQELRHTKL